MVKEVDSVLKVGKELADYIVELSYDDLSSDVTHQASRVILDSLATMYMGTRKEDADGIIKFLEWNNAAPDCTVIGTSLKTSVSWAAWANAAYAQVHDCNDGHREAAALGGSSHPGRVAIPTALALGEKLHLSGKEIIAAVVVGYDVATKLRGMNSSPPTSAYCTASIAGKLIGLDADEMRFALGIAGFNSPRNFPRTMGLDTNFLSYGYQAKIGIEAAYLAKEGFNGPKLGDDSRLSTRFKSRGLGEKFEVMNVYIKPYPTCRMTHGANEALLKMKQETEITPENVKEVKISQLTYGMYIADEKVGPDSYYKNCQFNLQYIAACTIADGMVTEAQFTKERIADPLLHELAEKVKVSPDEELDSIYPEGHRPTVVEVILPDDASHKMKIDYPWGDPRNPLTDEQLLDKFLNWSIPSISDDQGRTIWKQLQRLDEIDDISEFMRIL